MGTIYQFSVTDIYQQTVILDKKKYFEIANRIWSSSLVQEDIQFQHYLSTSFIISDSEAGDALGMVSKDVHSRKKGHLTLCLGKAYTETGWHTSVNYLMCKPTQLQAGGYHMCCEYD